MWLKPSEWLEIIRVKAAQIRDCDAQTMLLEFLNILE
jgi:hypothetical protein